MIFIVGSVKMKIMIKKGSFPLNVNHLYVKISAVGLFSTMPCSPAAYCTGLFVLVYSFSCAAAVEHHIKSTISSTDKQLPPRSVRKRARRVKKDM